MAVTVEARSGALAAQNEWMPTSSELSREPNRNCRVYTAHTPTRHRRHTWSKLIGRDAAGHRSTSWHGPVPKRLLWLSPNTLTSPLDRMTREAPPPAATNATGWSSN